MTASAGILGYRRFLERRDGAPDVYRETLSRRESFYLDIQSKPVRSRRRYDRAVFLRNLARRRPETDLDERLLWLLATAKANQSERFGVELGKLYGRAPGEDHDPEQVHVYLQESYHTRTLAEVVGMFGLPVPPQPPGLLPRVMIHLMVFSPLPERFTLPLVGASEILGCTLFRLLRDRGIALFADEPDVAGRIRLLFDEILADEICHVGLVDARLGRRGRRLMRRLHPIVAKRMIGSMPEMVRLFGRDELERALGAPFDQRTRAAEFPDTAFAF